MDTALGTSGLSGVSGWHSKAALADSESALCAPALPRVRVHAYIMYTLLSVSARAILPCVRVCMQVYAILLIDEAHVLRASVCVCVCV